MAVKYKWLAGRLREMIHENMQKGIPTLPTESDLCHRYHVSRQTVRTALAILESDGLITRRQGSGCFITGLLDTPSLNHIGILVPYEQEYLYPHLLHDIQKVLASFGLTCDIYLTQNRHDREREILSTLLHQNCRGILVEAVKSALPNPNLDLYQQLLAKDTKIVFLQEMYTNLCQNASISCVSSDSFTHVNTLFSHLISLGHQNISALLCIDNVNDHHIYSLFAEAYLQHHLPFADENVLWMHSQEYHTLMTEEAYLFPEKKIQELLNSCTCVICRDDLVAYHLIKTLQQHHHLTIPDNFSVCALNHTYLSQAGLHFITGIAYHPHDFGRNVVSLLLNELRGMPSASVTLTGHLVLGNTTSKLE